LNIGLTILFFSLLKNIIVISLFIAFIGFRLWKAGSGKTNREQRTESGE